MDFGKLRRFVREHGDVFALSSGSERRLPSGEQDLIDVVERAERFRYKGKFYTKEEFEELVDSAN